MFHAAGYGVIAALLAGIVVGFWAAIVNASPEVTGGIASGLGAACGMAAFGLSVAIRVFKRNASA